MSPLKWRKKSPLVSLKSTLYVLYIWKCVCRSHEIHTQFSNHLKFYLANWCKSSFHRFHSIFWNAIFMCRNSSRHNPHKCKSIRTLRTMIFELKWQSNSEHTLLPAFIWLHLNVLQFDTMNSTCLLRQLKANSSSVHHLFLFVLQWLLWCQLLWFWQFDDRICM